MEHTLQAYLERCSSEKLMAFLESCMLENQWNQYAESVPQIFMILEKRKVGISESVKASWCAFLRDASHSGR